MVKGEKLADDYWMNIDPEQMREQEYYYDLLAFEGVEGTSYGIMDELHDLDKLIETIGNTVVKEEREFKDVQRAADPDGPFPGEEVLKVWHKKMYRQFTYKSMMMLIHTTFETGIVNFYNLLVVEGRIADTVRRKNVIDILKSMKGLDPAIPSLIEPIRGFNFIRNKVAHLGGYYKDPDTDIDAFKKLIKNRADITTKKLTSRKGKHTHEMTIIRSTVLTDYLGTIKKVFQALLRGGQKLPYSPAIPHRKSFWRTVLNYILIPFKWIGRLWKRKSNK